MKLLTCLILLFALLASSSFAAGLEITQIDVRADYDQPYTYKIEDRHMTDSASVPVSNNTKIGVDVLPGSNVTFTLRVENTFRGNDINIRDGTVNIIIEEVDGGSDLEEESADFTLDPGDDTRVDVKFYIPLRADSGTFNVLIDAKGEDKNRTRLENEVKLKLEVKKLSHDVRITNAFFSPDTVDCIRKTRLTAEIANAGTSFENELALEFRSTNLGINSYDKDISLKVANEANDADTSYKKSINIEVPAFFKEVNYPVYVNLYWKGFILFDQKIINLNVRECQSRSVSKPIKKQQQKNQTNNSGLVEVITPEEEGNKGGAGISHGEITTSTEGTYVESFLFWTVILGGIIVIILALAALFGYVRIKKSSDEKTNFWE